MLVDSYTPQHDFSAVSCSLRKVGGVFEIEGKALGADWSTTGTATPGLWCWKPIAGSLEGRLGSWIPMSSTLSRI